MENIVNNLEHLNSLEQLKIEVKMLSEKIRIIGKITDCHRKMFEEQIKINDKLLEILK